MIADQIMSPDKVLDFLLAVSEDLQLDQALSGLGMSLEAYAKKLAEKGTIAYEVEDDRLVSCVIGYTHDTPDQGSYITLVATKESHRQKGIANRLLFEYFAYAKRVGMHYIWLITCIRNIAAQRLYEQCGFRKTDTIENKLTGKQGYRYEYHF